MRRICYTCIFPLSFISLSAASACFTFYYYCYYNLNLCTYCFVCNNINERWWRWNGKFIVVYCRIFAQKPSYCYPLWVVGRGKCCWWNICGLCNASKVMDRYTQNTHTLYKYIINMASSRTLKMNNIFVEETMLKCWKFLRSLSSEEFVYVWQTDRNMLRHKLSINVEINTIHTSISCKI